MGEENDLSDEEFYAYDLEDFEFDSELALELQKKKEKEREELFHSFDKLKNWSIYLVHNNFQRIFYVYNSLLKKKACKSDNLNKIMDSAPAYRLSKRKK